MPEGIAQRVFARGATWPVSLATRPSATLARHHRRGALALHMGPRGHSARGAARQQHHLPRHRHRPHQPTGRFRRARHTRSVARGRHYSAAPRLPRPGSHCLRPLVVPPGAGLPLSARPCVRTRERASAQTTVAIMTVQSADSQMQQLGHTARARAQCTQTHAPQGGQARRLMERVMSLRRLEQHGVRSSLPFLFLFSFSVLGCLLLPSACACSYYHAF